MHTISFSAKKLTQYPETPWEGNSYRMVPKPQNPQSTIALLWSSIAVILSTILRIVRIPGLTAKGGVGARGLLMLIVYIGGFGPILKCSVLAIKKRPKSYSIPGIINTIFYSIALLTLIVPAYILISPFFK